MGNCVSVHKSTDSAMKLGVQIESPIEEYTAKIENPIAELGFKPQSSPMTHVASLPDLSSKEEIFFDSHLWLESDCEDYFSVNGDLTPSCGNTPIHPNSFLEAPRLDKPHNMDSAPESIPEPSPTDMKKQLIELFRESFNSELIESNQDLQDWPEAKPISFEITPKSTYKSPYESVPNSVCSTEATPYRRSYSRKEKSAQSAQCCLPSLVRSLSFSERKKRLSLSNTSRQ